MTTTPTTRSATDSLNAALPFTIEGSACEHCGNELAWRNGVGRVVITHAHGSDKCKPVSPTATLSQADIPLAQAAIDTVGFLLALGKNTP